MSIAKTMYKQYGYDKTRDLYRGLRDMCTISNTTHRNEETSAWLNKVCDDLIDITYPERAERLIKSEERLSNFL